ncbi:MAG: GHKL domain-containing protein [Lachnospiraceae bacterium]|nr:GHKL domain-containing protein [Lachnospiraceae bacterium]
MDVIYWGIEYVASFLEVIMCFYFCGSFIDKKSVEEKRRRVMFLSVLSAFIIIGLNSIQMFSSISALLFLVVCAVFLWIVYRRAVISTILILIYAVLLSAIDFLTAYLMTFLLRTEMQYLLSEQSSKRVICIVFSKILLIMLLMLINKLYNKKNEISSKYMVVMCLSSIFLLLSNIVTIGNIGTDSEIFSMIFFLVSIGIQILLFYFVLNMADYSEQQQTLALIEMKNNMLQKSLDDTERSFELWRQSVHDYKNNIISLAQLAESGDVEKIKAYLEKENELINAKMFYIKTGNSIVDAVINTKQKIAEEKGILFSVNAVVPENCNINGMDLAKLLGNLIDNAIEASEKESNGYIDINIRQNKKFLMIVIKNKFIGKLTQNMQTTKENKKFHGIGLKTVKSIVLKYNGEISFDSDKEEFCVNILLMNE